MRGVKISAMLLMFMACMACTGQKKKNQGLTSVNDELSRKESLVSDLEFLYSTGECVEVIQIIDTLMQIDTVYEASYFYKRAYCLSYLEDYDRSNEDFQVCIELNFRSADSYFMMGLNFADMGDDSVAIQQFNQALILLEDNNRNQDTVIKEDIVDSIISAKKRLEKKTKRV